MEMTDEINVLSFILYWVGAIAAMFLVSVSLQGADAKAMLKSM